MMTLRWLRSFRLSWYLMALYAIALATATLVEKYAGTPVAFATIYHAPWFLFFQLLLVSAFLGAMWHRRSSEWRRRWAFWTIHLALIVMLCGAAVSHFGSEEGLMHLREGETGRTYLVGRGAEQTVRQLPFDVRLDDFRLLRYPGSMSPASYESDVTVFVDGTARKAEIYMNHVLDVGGYRFFQTSYDPDEAGTVLTVNRDAAGRRITYAGYALLAIGLAGIFFDPRSRFRRVGRRLKRLRRLTVCALLAVAANAQGAAPPVEVPAFLRNNAVPLAHAERFGALPVQSYAGRIMPVNTLGREILRKLVRAETVGGLTADQFLLSIHTWPQQWAEVPLFEITDNGIARRYGLKKGGRCTFMQLFGADGTYRLQHDLERAFAKAPGERTRFDKELIKLDERANTFYALAGQQLLRIFPCAASAEGTWYAPGDDLSAFKGGDSLFVSRIFGWYVAAIGEAAMTKNTEEADSVLHMITTYQQAKGKEAVDARKTDLELTYNRLQPFRTCRVGYLVLGGLLLVAAFAQLFRQRRWLKVLTWVLFAGVLMTFHYHMAGMAMRWQISGYAPWSNAYETLIYVAWATACAGLFFVRRNPIVTALATLLAGIMLFVSGLSWMDPQITPLIPVLRSVWLLFHVAVIVAAYGFFGIGCLLGIVNLVLLPSGGRNKHKRLRLLRVEELTLINERVLWIGLLLMTVGTFLGAIWANESWGRYWGWDPKETWALITMLAYGLVTHMHLVFRRNRLLWFNVAAIVAFLTVLMTFFGVNYWLSGVHSYA